jgi:hypothetical protein
VRETMEGGEETGARVLVVAFESEGSEVGEAGEEGGEGAVCRLRFVGVEERAEAKLSEEERLGKEREEFESHGGTCERVEMETFEGNGVGDERPRNITGEFHAVSVVLSVRGELAVLGDTLGSAAAHPTRLDALVAGGNNVLGLRGDSRGTRSLRYRLLWLGKVR